MKKIFRITALILAAVMLSVTLCSCNYLDSAREHQAFYTDDKKREIELEGHTYKLLNPDKYDYIYSDLYGQEASYSVTTKDVPVLLASRMGEYVNMVEGRTLLYLFGYSDEPIWYVRDDMYEKMSSLISNAELDHYYFYYYVPEELYGGVIQKNELLSDEMTELINRTASMADDKKVSYKELSKNNYRIATVFACDKDMLITNTNNNLTLIKDGTNYYIWDGNTYKEKVLCPVKKEDVSIIAAFFKDNERAVYDDHVIRYAFDESAYDYDEEFYESDLPVTEGGIVYYSVWD